MIGTVRVHDGQTFECVGLRPYRTADGRNISLEVWRFECTVCSIPGIFSRPHGAEKFQPYRRCSIHRMKGVRAGSDLEKRKAARRQKKANAV